MLYIRICTNIPPSKPYHQVNKWAYLMAKLRKCLYFLFTCNWMTSNWMAAGILCSSTVRFCLLWWARELKEVQEGYTLKLTLKLAKNPSLLNSPQPIADNPSKSWVHNLLYVCLMCVLCLFLHSVIFFNLTEYCHR